MKSCILTSIHSIFHVLVYRSHGGFVHVPLSSMYVSKYSTSIYKVTKKNNSTQFIEIKLELKNRILFPILTITFHEI